MRPPPPVPPTFTALLLLLAPRLVFGSLVNITVDNAAPNPTTGAAFSYAPDNTWNEGNGCGFCSAKPNASLAYNQTWQDVSFDPNTDGAQYHEVQTATLQFNGTAIYVYGIIQPAADYSFFIDGEKTGNFTFIPAVPASVFTYNVLLYHNLSIPSGSHTFVMQNGGTVDVVSLGLLDYAIYTTETDDAQGTSSSTSSLGQSGANVGASSTGTTPASPSNTSLSGNASPPKSKINTSIIVAAVVPSVVAVIILIALLVYWCRHRGRRWGTKKIPPSTEYTSQTGGRPVMQGLPMSGNETLRPYMVDRDQGSIPPQKGSISDTIMQATSSPTIPAMSIPAIQTLVTPFTSSPTMEAISERDGSVTSATPLRAHTTPSEVSSTGVPPSWIPGSEPPPAYGA